MTDINKIPPGAPETIRNEGHALRCRQILLLIVFLGGACRLAHYLSDPSYWHDEALVVMNVMDRSAPELVGKLDYAQAAPPLYLLAERALYLSLGGSEYALRLISLACGLAALFLFAWICWRILPPDVACWITGFFAFSDKLIWHSAEVKPYSSDAFAAVALLAIVLLERRSRGPGPVLCPDPRPEYRPSGEGEKVSESRTFKKFILLSAAATLLIWFSFPAAIVFGGLSLTLLPCVLRSGPRQRLIYLMGNALVGVCFLLLFHFSVRPQHVEELSSFWAKDFPPYAHPGQIPRWLLGEIYALCDHSYRSFGAIILILALAGVPGWRRSRRDVLSACLLPISLAILAAFLKQYPFNGDRLTIYLVPGLFLLCGGGLLYAKHASRGRPAPWRWVACVLAGMVVGRGVVEASIHLVRPRSWSDARPIAQYVRGHRRPGEGLYLVVEPESKNPSYQSGLNLELLCYWRHPPGPVHRGMPIDLSQIPEKRFWVVFTSLPKLSLRGVEPLVNQLKPFAAEQERYVCPDRAGAALLFAKKG